MKKRGTVDVVKKLTRNKRSIWIRRLVFSVLVLSLLALSYPFWPWVYYHLFHPKINASPYHNAAIHGGNPDLKPGNRIILPSIGVDSQILEAPNITILDKQDGVWHDTADKNPTVKGNMVIAGHRFRYRWHKSNDFYNLTAIKNGALIYVIWDKKVYEYQVFSTKTVTPNHIEIRNDNKAVPYELTLYTCNLLNSNLDRFVVFARLTEHKE